MISTGVLATLILSLSLLPLPGADAQTIRLADMVHTSWTAKDGAPQRIVAIAQAHDGGLWIGSAGGLYQFDGLNFIAFHSLPGELPMPAAPIWSMLLSADGTLWVGLETAGLVEIRDGHTKTIRDVDGNTLGTIEEIRQGPDGC